jgi:hypothetical protein
LETVGTVAAQRYSAVLGATSEVEMPTVAQETERPEWKPGDFLGEKYGKK